MHHSQRCLRRRGVTLVELAAGLALLGTLLVSLLIAKGRYTRQWAMAQRRLTAVAAAEDLLEAWWQDLEQLPREAEGLVELQPPLRWRTQVRDDRALQTLGAQVVRLEIAEVDGGLADEPLVAVELVLPHSKEVEHAEPARQKR